MAPLSARLRGDHYAWSPLRLRSGIGWHRCGSVGEIVKQSDTQPPFVILELETGYLRVLESLDDLRRFVEEFFDIFDGDFQAWNSRGHALTVDREFLDREEPPKLAALNEPGRMVAEISRFVTTAEFRSLEPRQRDLLEKLLKEARE